MSDFKKTQDVKRPIRLLPSPPREEEGNNQGLFSIDAPLYIKLVRGLTAWHLSPPCQLTALSLLRGSVFHFFFVARFGSAFFTDAFFTATLLATFFVEFTSVGFTSAACCASRKITAK